MKKILTFIAVIFLSACSQQPETHSSTDPVSFVKIYTTESSFDDAKDDLLMAIEGHGLVVSYTSHAQEMLDRTADVAGVTTPVYDRAEIILFCKADLSHKLVAANPHNLVLCPYAIAIYALYQKPETVYLSFREPEASEATTKPIRQLLVDIIEEVI